MQPSEGSPSIKPNTSGTSSWMCEIMERVGRLIATNATVANLIAVAYGAPNPLARVLVVN